MTGSFELHRLLWDLRHDAAVAERARTDFDDVARSYGLGVDEAGALRRGDFAALLAMGTNPMLLYFGALDLGVERDTYYEQLRGAAGLATGGTR